MKKGALAASAVAIGAGATAGTVAAQQDQQGEVLVYGDDYRPGVDFTVVSEMNTVTKEDVIAASGAEEDVFDDPDDWDAYIINYDLGSDAPTWGILLTEDLSFSAGDSGTMGENGQFRDPQLHLIEATPGATADGDGGDGEDGDGEDGDGDDEEEDG